MDTLTNLELIGLICLVCPIIPAWIFAQTVIITTEAGCMIADKIASN